MVVTEALVYAEKGARAELLKVELDAPEAGEVLIRMVACGLCHTDLALASGAFPSPFPTVVGHEGAGIVEAVGSGVQTVQKGDSVLLSFASCGACHYCSEGQPAICTTWLQRNFGRERGGTISTAPVYRGVSGGQPIWGNFFGQSAFSRLALVSESCCVKVPSTSDLRLLAPLGCGLQTGAGTVYNRLKPTPTSSLVITGLGAVGIGALFAAVALKVQTIIVVDVVESRMDLAKSLGATHAVNGMDPDVINLIKKATRGGEGPTYGIECTGRPSVFRMAFEAICKGGTLITCGTPGPGHNSNLEIDAVTAVSKTWGGTVEGDSNPPVFIPFLVDLHRQGKFPLEKITKQFRLDQFEEAVAAMHSGSVIKPIIIFDDRQFHL